MPLQKSCGSYSAPVGDGNDCSVRALSIAANIPYSACSALFAKHGRTPGRRTPHHVTRGVYRELGIPAPMYYTARPTVAQFIRENPKGRFILTRSGHAFSLVDSVIHDWADGTGPRSRILFAARVPDTGITRAVPFTPSTTHTKGL